MEQTFTVHIHSTWLWKRPAGVMGCYCGTAMPWRWSSYLPLPSPSGLWEASWTSTYWLGTTLNSCYRDTIGYILRTLLYVYFDFFSNDFTSWTSTSSWETTLNYYYKCTIRYLVRPLLYVQWGPFLKLLYIMDIYILTEGSPEQLLSGMPPVYFWKFWLIFKCFVK